MKNLKEDVLKKKLSKKEEEGKKEKQMVMGKVIKIAKEAAHNIKEGKKKANREKLLDSIESDSKESEYLKRYQKISYLEYGLMFPSLEEFWQGRLGDCYLISTIQSWYFNTLMMTSIHVSKDWEYWKISAIKVLNPWNHKGVEWWAEQTLNLSEFFNAFSLFDSGTITDTFLDHRTSKEETMVVDWGAMRRRRDKKYA